MADAAAAFERERQLLAQSIERVEAEVLALDAAIVTAKAAGDKDEVAALRAERHQQFDVKLKLLDEKNKLLDLRLASQGVWSTPRERATQSAHAGSLMPACLRCSCTQGGAL
jgi:hypothetical protein